MGARPLAVGQSATVPKHLASVKKTGVAPLPRRSVGERVGVGSGLVFFGLVLAAADRGAENVAEAGSRVGRAELGHRPLLLVDLARLDRRGDLACRAVDRGDLGVDPLADRT